MKKQNGAGRKKPAPAKKPGTGPKLLLAAVTCVNLLLTLVLAVLRRQDTLRAVSGDGQVKLLLEKGADKHK